MSKVIHNFCMEIDDQTILYANILKDETGRYNLENICLITYLEKTMEVDIWNSLPEKYQAYYKTKAFEKYHQSQVDKNNFGDF